MYVAVRMPGKENQQFWTGTHTRAFQNAASLSLSITDAYITFKSGATLDYVKYRIDHTKFTDSSTPAGRWHNLEFPFDNTYETYMDSGNTFYPNEIIIDMSVTWTRTGNVYSNGVTENNDPTPYSKWRDLPGMDLLQLSDLRVGDTDLIDEKFLINDIENDELGKSIKEMDLEQVRYFNKDYKLVSPGN